MFEALYTGLKPEDKAFVDGYAIAIKDACENAMVEDEFINPDLPEDSLINKHKIEVVTLFQKKTKEYMEARLHDLIQGTLDSYEEEH